MNILIFGAGAIGIWVASQIRLVDPIGEKFAVSLLGRTSFVETARAEGIAVSTSQQSAMRLNAINPIDTIERLPFSADVVIICTKTYSVESVIAEFERSPYATNPVTQFVCFQNGIGSDEKLAAVFGANNVIAATTTVPVSMVTPAHILVERLKGGAGVASLGNNADSVRKVAQCIRATIFEDWRSMKWSKLLLNIIGNATSAILGMPVANIYEDEIGYQLEKQMLQECLAVMKKLGIEPINLPSSPARRLSLALRYVPDGLLQPILKSMVAKGRGDKWPSFYYEMARKTGRCEVVDLNGAIARFGKKIGVATPVNEKLTHVLMALVDGQVSWDEWRGQIKKLAQQ
jgi:2-dehydropantoate 2-reductase